MAAALDETLSLRELNHLGEVLFSYHFPKRPMAADISVSLNILCFGGDIYPGPPLTNMWTRQALIMICDAFDRDFIAMGWLLPCARDQIQLTAVLTKNRVNDIKISMGPTDKVAAALLMGLSKASMAQAPDDQQLTSSTIQRMEEIGKMPDMLIEDMLIESMITCL